MWLVCFVPLETSGAEEAGRVDIFEYQLDGIYLLPEETVEQAVSPYLGEARTAEDVERARAALEKAYHDAGYQTASVQIPQQEVIGGLVRLQVVEGTVGRLRVHGSRYFDIERIKADAPSLAEGATPDFGRVTQDILALNQHADRRITPALKAGVEPGTIDIELNVEDKMPLHGNLELNNRHSANTTALRLNGSISYANLWQREHTLGLSFQIAPERLDDAKVFSAYYLVPVPDAPVKLMLQGMKHDSDISTLGTFDVAGRGESLGLQAIVSLPGTAAWSHGLTAGIDYKRFDELLTLGGTAGGTQTPITYYPISVAYSATHLGQKSLTQLNGGLNFHIRGLGSDSEEFSNKRYGADGSYFYFRGDIAHTQTLPDNWELFGKLSGQLSSRPLISSEQFGAGGLGTVRGYLESEAMGDYGFAATLEVRTPPFTLGGFVDELRAHVFTDWAGLILNDALADQDSRFLLGSIGAGLTLHYRKHFHGSADAGLPLYNAGSTEKNHPRVTFRVWADF
ncbi:ShlB/FhaC/HecB family hemolysin secretion/activation protein [Termitidicoccus mucosus]|uniref:Hemin-binding protein n=1 Tax=Termitidicoccus mucosus TaxID=1184151 RepID=A0A178IJW8_9BACT|nr:hemin-binding protein [Opitutaceae bacterium TSB47]